MRRLFMHECFLSPRSLSSQAVHGLDMTAKLPAKGKGGMCLPPMRVAETVLRHTLWWKGTRGAFSRFRQARFGK
jgi:hypothetical protein